MNRSAALSLAAGLVLAAAVTSVGTAGAAPAALPSDCTQGGTTQAGTTFTCTFTAAGESAFTVHSGVTSITASAVGAQGAGGTANIPAASTAGGGGGGSSYAAPSVTSETFVLATAGQAPSVTISFTLPTSAIQITRIRPNPPGPDTGSNPSLNAEWIRITNTGRTARQLRGWSIKDQDGHVYRFKRLALRPHATVTVHSGRGRDRAAHRYWNRHNYIWDNSRELARLRRPDGKLASSCRYDRTHPGRGRC